MRTVYKDDVGSLLVEEYPEIGLVLHVDIYKWGIKAFRHSEGVFDSFLLSLAEFDIKEIHSLISLDDRKLQKFAAAFGFMRTGKQMILIDNPESRHELWKVTTGVQ